MWHEVLEQLGLPLLPVTSGGLESASTLLSAGGDALVGDSLAGVAGEAIGGGTTDAISTAVGETITSASDALAGAAGDALAGVGDA